SGKQQIAGDASGNGLLTAYDSSLVGQFAVGVLPHLPVAVSQGSDWKFLRCDSYPVCTDPTYSYSPLSQAEVADFYALLYGDVSGNWQSATLASSQTSSASGLEDEAAAHDRILAAQLS